MESQVFRARAWVFVILAGTLAALGPSVGWWPLAPLAATAAGFQVADVRMTRSARPEYVIMAAWAFSQAMIGLSIALTGGPHSLFIAWLAIPAATLHARFNTRGVLAGVAWTAVIMLAVTVGVHPSQVAADPAELLVPMSLLVGVTLLTGALKRSDVEHRAAAALDPLTGLFNRRALMQRGGQLIDEALAPGRPLAVVIADLDHFKHVNDRYGHAAGDAVLRATADTLRSELRGVDYIYRYGGEEFVMLLPGADAAGAKATAERLRIAVAQSRPAGVEVTMSFGVAVEDRPDTDLDRLLSAADTALYQAKAEGRNLVCVTTPRRPVGLAAPASAARKRPEAGQGATRATAFTAARRMYLQGRRVDMQELAAELGVSDETLRGWLGDREQVLSEIIVSLSTAAVAAVRHAHRDESGPEKILGIYRDYVLAIVRSTPLQVFLQQETHTALEVLTSSGSLVQTHMVNTLYDVLREEQEANAFSSRADLRDLAYAIVRMTEGFLYNDAILANVPQVERAAGIVTLMLD